MLISQKGVARSYQITNIMPNASALENVRIAAQSRRHGWNMLSRPQALSGHQREGGSRARFRRPARARPTNWPPTCRTANSATSRSASRSPPNRHCCCLDEPTAGMSAAETHDTMQLVRRIAQNNLTILIVEHDMQVVMELCHRITVLHYGAILADGTPEEIQRNPQGAGGLSQDMSAAADSAASRWSASRACTPITARATFCTASRYEVGAGRGGRPARPQRRRQDRRRLKTIMGLVQPSHGQRAVSTAPPSPASRRIELARLGIGYVPEDRRIFRLLTVMENLRTGLDRARRHDEARASKLLDKAFTYFPRARRAAQPGRRHAVGRRAADAGDRARHDAGAEDHPARRADRGPDAAHGLADPRDHRRAAPAKAWPSCWSSRTCR